MSKKIGSIIIIFITIIYVTITLHLNGYNTLDLGSIKVRQVINSIVNLNKNPKITYEEVKQNSEIVVQNNTQNNTKFEGKTYKLNILKMSKATKEIKLENLYLSERELLKNINDKTIVVENYSGKENDKDSPVFNSDIKYNLTDDDKERILIASKKLSPLDQEKINTYLKYINTANAKNAINLLRDRLSDKDFEKIKDISIKVNKK